MVALGPEQMDQLLRQMTQVMDDAMDKKMQDRMGQQQGMFGTTATSTSQQALFGISPLPEDKLEMGQLHKNLTSMNATNFTDWKWKLEVAFVGMHAHASKLLSESEICKYVVTTETLEQSSPSLAKLSNQLYSILAQKAELNSECVDIIRNVPNTCGAEAWRRLCRRFCGRTAGREVHTVRQVVAPGKIKKIDDTRSSIEKWGHTVNRLSGDFDINLPEQLRVGIIIEMMPSAISDLATQTLVDKEPYPSVKDKILRFVESRRDYNGPKGMDLDEAIANRLEMGDKKETDHDHTQNDDEANAITGKSKGKGQPFQGH